MSTDRIVGEYTIKVDEAIKNLEKMANRIEKLESASKKAAKNTESEYEKMTSNLMGQFKNLAGAIGIAFSVQQVVALGREMVTLAAQAEGVERAFKRVGSPQLLADLRKATRGTVSDLQLMKNAVKASNFKIPLENLAALFKFAQARARETGESVDYLVDSIILGIGRKSPLILDNLGISAVELRERLKGVGVEASSVGDIAQIIGDIATEELEKMGSQADTTADKIAQIGTSFENIKVEGGQALILLLEDIENAWKRFTNITAFRASEANNELNESFKEGTRIASLRIERIEKETEAENERIKAVQRALDLADTQYEKEQKVIKQLQQSIEIGDFRGIQGIKALNQIKEQISVSDQYSESLLAQIDVFAKYLDLKDEDNRATQEQIKNVAYYLALIKDLEDEQKLTNTTLERNAVINAELKVAREELARLLGKETEAVKKANDEWEKFLKTLREIDEDDPFAGQLLKGEQEVDQLSKSLQEAFGTEGTERIQMFWDDFLRSSLEALDKTGNKLDESLNLFNDYASAVSEIYQGIQAVISATYQREYDDLQRQLDNGLISREQYEEELNTIRRREAAANKDAAIFNAVISTAQAVVNALGAFPFSPSNIALAAAIGAAGAAQIAAIASQPLPQFAEGGFVDQHGEIKGRKHKYGGVVIEAEGGEFITSAKYARPNAEILKAINSGDWEKYKVDNIIAPAIEQVLKGGFGGMSASYELNSMFNDKNILKVLDRNRQAERDSANYIVKGITKGLSRRQSRWN